MTSSPAPVDLSLLGRLFPALGNPFEQEAEQARAIDELRARKTELVQALGRLERAGRARELRQVILLVALAQRIDDQPLVEPRVVPDSALALVELTRADVRNVIGAAERCARKLREFGGVSAQARRLRVDTWRACFGSSLDDAVRLQRLIREQNVLILGETGTGKELIADALQAGAIGGWNDERPAPQQAINAAAIPEELLESELFGHVRGAFSGAFRDREGKIVAASGGTLFFDELADLPLSLQPKLLRVIQSNRVVPIGANQEITVDVRYLAATSCPVAQLLDAQKFRRDLYERLAGVTLTIAPLRERPEDIKPIARTILLRLQLEEQRRRDRLSAPASIFGRMASSLEQWRLTDYDWPGNVRELENFIRTRILGFGGPPPNTVGQGPRPATSPPATAPTPAGLATAPTPAAIAPTPAGLATAPTPAAIAPTPAGLAPALPLGSADDALGRRIPPRILAREATLDEVKEWYVAELLEQTGGNRALAARRLGIDRGTLSRVLQRGQKKGTALRRR